MKLVKFKDGTFGIRRGFWPFYVFKVIGSASHYWFPKHYESVVSMDEETARGEFNRMTDMGDVIE